MTEQILGDPFDYEAEDRLVAAGREGLEKMRAVRYARTPTAGASYVGAESRSGRRLTP